MNGQDDSSCKHFLLSEYLIPMCIGYFFSSTEQQREQLSESYCIYIYILYIGYIMCVLLHCEYCGGS